MRLTLLTGIILAGMCIPQTATGSDDSGFPLIAPATVDTECVRECLRENQHVAVGYEELSPVQGGV